MSDRAIQKVCVRLFTKSCNHLVTVIPDITLLRSSKIPCLKWEYFCKSLFKRKFKNSYDRNSQTRYYFLNFKNYKVGEEEYGQVAKKIDWLLEFGKKKGYDYDQILDSKPGETLATEILTFCRAEMSSTSFAKQLKNNLDETLVKNISSIESGHELNI